MLQQLKLNQPESDVARALRSNSAHISDSVAQALEMIPRWKKEAVEYPGARSEYVALQFQAFVDYAAEYFDRNDKTYFQLLVGEMLKALHDPTLDNTAASEQALRVVTSLRQDLLLKLSQTLSPQGQLRFSEFLDELSRFITSKPGKVQRVLFVGDCLFLDVLPFIAVSLLDVGVRLATDYATSKNSAVLRDQLRAFAAKKFDLVFYSPYTYEFSVEYNELLSWKNAFVGQTDINDRASRVWKDTSGTIDVLADLFDCPIHVHNSSAVIRDPNAAKRLIKAKATARIRSLGRAMINSSLPEYLNRKNAESFRHLFLFDEKSLVDEFGEVGAGAYIYKTRLQHPAVLGQVLSRQYIDLIFVNAWLLSRKIIVCDLDHTLWEGVIGEGRVTHHHDRQQMLKVLKAKGVLLAINSKNDPANVRWDGGTLSDQDFVCAAISWQPKVHGMQRIQTELNLKTKDFVFIDDRADERELMRQAYPEMLCLDATDENTWKRIELWATLLDESPEMDRTLMYKQREVRKAFVQENVSSPAERAALYRSLDLRLVIRTAKQSDLKRVTELINRTNQFNLEGSRTTIREVTHWHESPDHIILLGDSADRFGDMGTTCIAVARCRDKEMRILPFVLSCRVFGFGIEFGVMNHLKAIARERGARRILGRYIATPQNAPSADFLLTSGFLQLDEHVWSMDIDGESAPSPSWLAVKVA